MNLLYHRSDTQYHLLRKILGTLQGQNDAGSGSSSLNVTATGVSKVVVPSFTVTTEAIASAGIALTSMFDISGAIREAGKHTILHSAVLTDLSGLGADTYLLLYNNAGTDAAPTAGIDLGIGLSGFVGLIAFDDFLTLTPGGFGSVCSVRSIGLVIPPPASGTTLTGVLVTGGAVTYPTATSLGLKLGFLQD